jgi:hypothetical protein
MYTRALLKTAFGDMAEFEIREHDDVITRGAAISECPP